MRKLLNNKLIAVMLAFIMIFGQISFIGLFNTADAAESQPELIITGTGVNEKIIIKGEKWDDYTLVERFYSSNNSGNFHKITKVKGYDLFELIGEDNLKDNSDYDVKFTCSDGFNFTKKLSELKNQYYYPDFTEDNKEQINPMLSFYKKELISIPGEELEPPVNWENQALNLTSDKDSSAPRLIMGQTSIDQTNQSRWGQNIVSIQIGDPRPEEESILTINGMGAAKEVELTLSEIKSVPNSYKIDEDYTYNSKGGQKTVSVKGVDLWYVLNSLAGIGDASAVVDFIASDGYNTPPETQADISDRDVYKYVLAYEVDGEPVNDDDGDGKLRIYRKIQNDSDFGTVFKAVIRIQIGEASEIDFTESTYKHINYDGAPYNVDSISGATFTVEGPGVEAYRAITVSQIENSNGGLERDNYNESVDGTDTQNTYEGISVEYLLEDFVNLKDNAGDIIFKNKSRQEIGRYSLEEISDKDNKMIIAYGINGLPLVFLESSTGYEAEKNNDNGCLKLVYAQEDDLVEFSNVAYIYVEEADAGGVYEHENSPYNDPEFTNYLLTLSGSGLGKEVNYTVADIEDMTDIQVEKEYSLSNSEYFWYYNTYKGVKLWDLLLDAGLDENIDEDTRVKMYTADNYNFPAMTIKDIKDSSLYGYYEKHADDLGNGEFDGSGVEPIEEGYPVLVAYGFNGYPYIINTGDDGYNAGLGNDGGPLRVIFGKKDYSDNNGSNQVQFLSKVVIGDDTNYTTHSYDPYNVLKDNTVSVKVMSEETIISEDDYTVEGIEAMIYEKSASEKEKALVKDFYFIKEFRGNKISDLFEGIGLWYFLSEEIGLPGITGNIVIEDSEGTEYTFSLEEIKKDDYYNEVSGAEDVKPVLAYAKNGYPMIVDKDDPGYAEHNNGGPLAVLLGQTEAGIPGETINNVKKITVNIEKDKYAHIASPYDEYRDDNLYIHGDGAIKEVNIKVSELEALQDYIITGKYCKAKSADGKFEDTYRGININEFLRKEVGFQANAEGVTFIASDGYSKTFTLDELAKTDYINELSNIYNLKMMLAYGANELPLVEDSDSEGYADSSKNSGGPLKLVVGQTEAGDLNSSKFISNINEIIITVGDDTSWKHDHGVYTQYQDDQVLRITGDSVTEPTSFTLEELEELTDHIVRDTYTGDGTSEYEGIVLWDLIEDVVGLKDGVTNPSITIYSGTYNRTLQDLDQVKNGVENSDGLLKEIILAYAKDGYPLVPGTESEGYENNNQYGPIRLIVEENKSLWIKNTDCIVVGNGDYESPVTDDDSDSGFQVLGSGIDEEYTIEELSELEETTGQYSYSSRGQSVTDTCTGVLLGDLLEELGITDENTRIHLETTDGYDHGIVTVQEAVYQNYLITYEVNGESFVDTDDNDVDSSIRIYRNFDEGGSWRNKLRSISGLTIQDWILYLNSDESGLPEASVRTILKDDEELWVGTYGGGAAYLKDSEWTTVQEAVYSGGEIEIDTVYDIEKDSQDRLWMTVGGAESGKGVLCKDGDNWTLYNKDNSELPDNFVQEITIDDEDGIWFGTAKGAAYKDDQNNWTIFDKEDGLIADSVTKIVLDEDGGKWIGFYPDSVTVGGEVTYEGGYVYLNSDNTVIEYIDETDSSFGGNWVRSISIDEDGGVWVCRSGNYNGGAKIDYIDDNGNKTIYEASDIYTDIGDGDDIRLVEASNDGLWIATRASGLLFRDENGEITKEYNSTNQWPNAQWDNVYFVEADVEGNIWAGTNGGAGYYEYYEVDAGLTPPSNPVEDTVLTINGEGVERTCSFTLDELKGESDGIYSGTYFALNSYGTAAEFEFTGIKLEYILDELADLKSSAQSVKVVAEDGYYRKYNISDVEKDYIHQENSELKLPMILAWKEDGRNLAGDYPLKLVMGQTEAGDVNKSNWVRNIEKIVVINSKTNSGSGSPGNYAPDEGTGSVETDEYSQRQVIKDEQGREVEKIKFKAEMKDTIDDADEGSELSINAKDSKDSFDVEMSGSLFDSVRKKKMNMVIKSKVANYYLPSEIIPLDEMASKLGVDKEKINLSVKVSKVTQEQKAELTKNLKGQETLLADPVEFNIEFEADGKKLEYKLFGNKYVKRELELDSQVDTENATGVVWNEKKNRFEFVPTQFQMVDGKKVAVIMNRSNSIYTVIENIKTFDDIQYHWAKADIEKLASKLIINGKTQNNFAPSDNITRAEFAALLARVLSLNNQDIDTKSFNDIEGNEWFAGSVALAANEGIITGYEDNTFRANNNITREEMAVMFSRALKTVEKETSMSEAEKSEQMNTFNDKDSISKWAQDGVAEVVKCDIINGITDNQFSPDTNADRAQSAAMLRRFLTYIDFIN